MPESKIKYNFAESQENAIKTAKLGMHRAFAEFIAAQEIGEAAMPTVTLPLVELWCMAGMLETVLANIGRPLVNKCETLEEALDLLYKIRISDDVTRAALSKMEDNDE